MPSLTLDEIKNPDQLKAWIDAGETIDLRESDRVVAQIIPKVRAEEPKASASTAVSLPDFEARQKKLFGDRIFDPVQDGETVELCEEERIFTRIIPEAQSQPTERFIPLPPDKWPDFRARAKKILGDRVLPGSDLLIEERGRY
jgi:antitoxin (DNA-binding transcriptional repressor) of toxin-antitoxin stability system